MIGPDQQPENALAGCFAFALAIMILLIITLIIALAQ